MIWGFLSKLTGGKDAVPSAPLETPDEKNHIGDVEGYYRKLKVAVIKINKGTLNVDDHLLILGHTTRLDLKAKSLQIDHQPVSSAAKGQSVGLKVGERVRHGDKVYLVPA